MYKDKIEISYSPLIGMLKIFGESFKRYGDSYQFYRE
jgi:hypothetical protein